MTKAANNDRLTLSGLLKPHHITPINSKGKSVTSLNTVMIKGKRVNKPKKTNKPNALIKRTHASERLR